MLTTASATGSNEATWNISKKALTHLERKNKMTCCQILKTKRFDETSRIGDIREPADQELASMRLSKFSADLTRRIEGDGASSVTSRKVFRTVHVSDRGRTSNSS